MKQCPRCGAEVTVCRFGRNAKFAGFHEAHRYGTACAWRMGTWGYFADLQQLAEAIATQPPRHASPENIERVTAMVGNQIGAHSRAARLKKELIGMMRRLEEMEAA